ncbi:hypothetical protein E2C01_059728 [Portunus trituberculatus]|uniref:Uncharacterized protein n=1 Tax=Portunus trituberculatus TaxID=210409 RepID=A0A5B7H048_PORTR|nr:hypothetical protein [Portunus trituberculatus]
MCPNSAAMKGLGRRPYLYFIPPPRPWDARPIEGRPKGHKPRGTSGQYKPRVTSAQRCNLWERGPDGVLQPARP